MKLLFLLLGYVIIKVMRQGPMGPKGLTQKAYSLFKGDFLCLKLGIL